MKKFLLRMLTPERCFLEEEVLSVTVVDDKGEREILSGYQPVTFALPAATIRIDNGTERKICSNGEGILAVQKGVVSVLCQTFEWPQEIELSRVNRAISEHSERIKDSEDDQEYEYHEMTLKRAYARLALVKLARNSSDNISLGIRKK